MDVDVAHGQDPSLPPATPPVDSVPDKTTVDEDVKLTVEETHQAPGYKMRFVLGGHTRSITSLKFSPDGGLLASACESHWNTMGELSDVLEAADKLVKLWNAYTGEYLRTLQGHTHGVNDIAWSSDGSHIASASDDKTIKIWQMEFVGVPRIYHRNIGFIRPCRVTRSMVLSGTLVSYSVSAITLTRIFSYPEGTMKLFVCGMLLEVNVL